MNYLFSLLASAILVLGPSSSELSTASSNRVPYQIEVENCGSGTRPANGVYVLSSGNVDSDCECWSLVGNKQKSLGKYENEWFMFDAANCKAVVGNAIPLGPDTGCDPTVLSCITEAPLTITNCGSSMGNANGNYVKSNVDGDSSCDCWNKVGSNTQSFGQYEGQWFIFFTKNCKVSIDQGGMGIGHASGCEPSELACISYQ